jgi:hypothetical protein
VFFPIQVISVNLFAQKGERNSTATQELVQVLDAKPFFTILLEMDGVLVKRGFKSGHVCEYELENC